MEITCAKCSKPLKSLQAWKGHMSRMHGGYDDEDLQAVAGIGGGEGNIRERMAAFAQTMPGGEEGSTSGPPITGTSEPSPPPTPTERRVRATPKKLRKILAGIPSEILRQTGIELDNEDVEAMDEAGEFLSDVFGFEFVVPESKVTVQSRWWAFVWVAGVAGLVYVKHRFPEVFKYIFKAMRKNDGEETVDHGTELPDNPV